MKKSVLTISIFSILFCSIIVLLSSCKDEGYATISIKGDVTDNQGQFIDSLLITIKNVKTNTSDQFRYSNSSSNFERFYNFEKAEEYNFTVTIEDIDGERNGGYFQEQSKTISVSESDYTSQNDLTVIHPYAEKEVSFTLVKKY